MVGNKVIVTMAPTGGMASKKQNPNRPTQPEEIADDVYRCFNAGASIIAVHTRRRDDGATCNPEIYKRINSLIREKYDIVINNSTGGGINGDMVRQTANGYPQIMFDERIKGMEAGAEMCTLDPTTIVASFEGGEILMNTSPSRCKELAASMKKKGIKPGNRRASSRNERYSARRTCCKTSKPASMPASTSRHTLSISFSALIAASKVCCRIRRKFSNRWSN
jgi:3-keto-5-aminohexanoate cleavage enzyme